MSDFFAEQMDYIFFVYGLGFFILSIASFFLYKSQKNEPIWKWLGLFGFLHGINEWLDMFSVSIGDSDIFKNIRLFFLAASFMCLFELGRSSQQARSGKFFGRWIYVPMVLILAFGWVIEGATGVNIFSRYFFGVLGGVWAGAAIATRPKAVKSGKQVDKLFIYLGLIIILYAFTQMIVPVGKFAPAYFINIQTFKDFTGVPIQLFRAVLSILAAVVLWFYFRSTDILPVSGNNISKKYIVVVVFLSILFFGWVITEEIGIYAKNEYSNSLLINTRIASSAVNPRRILTLTGTEADKTTDDFIRLKEQLTHIRHARLNQKFVYLMGIRDKEVFFYVDAEPESSKDYAKPGDIYKNYPIVLLDTFKNGKEVVAGPYKDEWGEWFSAFVPIRSFGTEKIIAVLGIDISKKLWDHYVYGFRIYGIVVVIFVFVIFSIYFVVSQIRIIDSEKLRQSEERYRLLADNANDMVWILDSSGKFIYTSPSTRRQIGFAPEFEGSSTFENVLTPSSKIAAQNIFNDIMQRVKDKKINLIERFELEVLGKDGSTFWVDVSAAAVFSTNKEFKGIMGVCRDITDRKKLEDAILESEAKYKTLYNSSSDAIMILDPDDNFIEANPATLKLFNIADEKEFAKTSPAILSPEYQPDGILSEIKAKKMIFIALQKGSHYFEWIHKTIDGRVFPATVLLSKIKIADRILLQATVRDVTLFKKAEDELKKVVALKEDFISMVSHELRTPLTPIKEGVSIILDGLTGDINEEQRDLLSTVRHSADRLNRLVNNVLDFQKLKSGKMQFEIIENDIYSVINEVSKSMYLVAKEKGLILEKEVEDGLPIFKFDKDRITQVLTNLVNNAAKFTDKGSIKIIAKKDPDSIHVIVKDTGPGISPNDMGKLFQSFQQLDTTREKRTSGTGLGLAICKEIIDQHKGKIWAESMPASPSGGPASPSGGPASPSGKGSEFHFVLPL